MIFQPTIINQVSGDSGWNPPAHWNWNYASSQVQDGQNAFVGIFAIFPNVVNATRIVIGVDQIGGVLNWGDGASSSITLATNDLQHVYDYDSISCQVVNGAKLVYISGQFNGALNQFNIKGHPSVFLLTQYPIQSWLAIKVRSTLSGISYFAQNPNNQLMMRILDFGNLKISPNSLFRSHKALMILKFGGFGYAFTGTYDFSECSLPDFDWNSLDYSMLQSFAQMWQNSTMLMPYSLNISITACQSLYQAWSGSSTFVSIKLRNTSNVTSIERAIYGAHVRSYEMDDCYNISNTTLFVSASGQVLQRLILTNLRIGIDISNQQMTAIALNDFFSSIGTANGAQTITIKECIGALTCDRSIATNKGYTVIYQ